MGQAERLWQILLQKPKIERPGESRESRFLDAPAVARLSGANTKVGGRFGMKGCGPSCRHTRNASTVFKIFVLHPKKTFATISAPNGHGSMSDLSPLSGEERKSNFGAVRSVDDPTATLTAPGEPGPKPISAPTMCSFEPIQCCVLSLGADMQRREFITLLIGAASD